MKIFHQQKVKVIDVPLSILPSWGCIDTHSIGAADGDDSGSGANARIGNTVTLMNQRINYTVTQAASSESWNRMRVIIVESEDGNQTLNLSDILLYSDYGIYSNLVFVSPYTTKADTNVIRSIKGNQLLYSIWR